MDDEQQDTRKEKSLFQKKISIEVILENEASLRSLFRVRFIVFYIDRFNSMTEQIGNVDHILFRSFALSLYQERG